MTPATDLSDPIDRLRVDLGDRSYDVIVGDGLIGEAGRHAAPLIGKNQALVVADETVAELYLGTLQAALSKAGISHAAIILPPGEQTKDFAHLEDLTNQLLDHRVERGTTLIALGGGVIGDLTGFAASILLRGVPFIQIPTTLLSQVDSSVGGKTGINTRHGKNLIGAFYQPRLVLADIGALETLPEREFLAGYAEVVKYGFIDNPDFFEWLEKNAVALKAGDRALRRQAVLTSCAAKAAIVVEDEREAGRRALLNLGHTFGHALEAETGFGTGLLHGEAVAIGMLIAFDLSVRLGLCPPADAERARRHIADCGMRSGLKGLAGPSWTADRLIDHMMQDKKVLDRTPTFILLKGIGKAFISRDVPMPVLRSHLEAALAS